jgi:hypothetical protein
MAVDPNSNSPAFPEYVREYHFFSAILLNRLYNM